MKKIFFLFAALISAMTMSAVTYNVTVPAGTNACYIAGEMTGWSHTEMTKVDDTHYKLELADATDAMKYKYCSGPGWAYVEKTANGDEVADRTYFVEDVVEAWAAVYEPSATPEEPGETKDITVKAKVPAEWTDQITAWVWPTGGAGSEVVPTQEGDWYVVTENCTELNVIYKNGYGWNGDAYQTVDMTFTENACIEIIAGSGKATYTDVPCGDEPTPDTPEEPEVTPDPSSDETVYFVNNQGWTTVNAYAWANDGAVQNAAWPGVAATLEAEQIAGYDVYSYTAPAGTYANVIFNDGANQTADLVWTAGKYYVTDNWYTKEEAEALLGGDTPVDPTPGEVTYVLMGVAGDWTTGIALEANPENENEYMLLGQEIAEGDAVKVVTLTDGVATAYCGNVDSASVEHYLSEDFQNIVLAPGIYDFYYKVAEDLIYIGASEVVDPTPEPEYYEDVITNMQFDLENMVIIGGPSEAFQVDVFLVLGEDDGSGQFQLTEESSVAVMGSDAKFIEGIAYEIDAYAPAALVDLVVEWEGMLLQFHLTMSAAPMEATVVVVENATLEVQEYEIFDGMYEYAATLTGNWYNEADGLTYPVLVELPVYYPEATEPYEIMTTVTVGGWEDTDPWLGFGEGYLTVSIVDGVVTAAGIVENPMAGVAIDITITTGTLTPDVPADLAYVLMGVDGDWDTGIALEANPSNENEYMLLGQEIKEGDAVKVVTLTNGVATAWCGNVDEYSATHQFDENGNIVLAPGIYDFYYKVAEDLIYIGAVGPVDPTPDPEDPKDITVKAKVPAEWTDPITVWVWATGMEGQAAVPTQEGEWYVYTHTGSELNIIFRNGEDWTGDQNQTVDMYFTESACIEIIYNEGAKADYAVVDCEGGTPVDPTPGEVTYVLMGVAGDWTTGIALTRNESALEEEYVLLNQPIAEGDAVKVVTLTDGVATAYCGNVDEASAVEYYLSEDYQNIVLAPGTYDFYYKVATDNIYIAVSTATGVDNIDVEKKAVKVIRDGQMFIIRDNVVYSVLGQVVK